ncbi:MAG TPA: hypothetical protein DD473_17815 [Planctomycetaceae bacterium]|nr:hypothetical protein [Planctomycetaceae bacterium]
MRLLIVEPSIATRFTPIALMRPVFELLCGTRSLRQRLLETLPVNQWGVIVRDELQAVYQEEFPEAAVNDFAWIDAEATLIVDGTWLGDPRILLDFWDGESGKQVDDFPFAFVRRPGDSQLSTLSAIVQKCDRSDDSASVSKPHLQFPWDLIKHNGDMIQLDFVLQAEMLAGRGQDVSGLCSRESNPRQIFIHPTAKLEPFVSINAENGPVIVDEGAIIQSFTRLEGPYYIGRQTQLFRANIRGETSLGPVCRVGGEVEASIMQGYSNKYHDGFLGHSYVCPWVNLGALTSNSDLKNDYSSVKFPLGTDFISTGEKKIGCLIGDHAKTAIGTLFNTGSNVGVMSMVLPAGRLCPKHIPSFTRLWHGKLDDQVDFEAACQTAQIAMSRRGQKLTDSQIRLLHSILDQTQQERELAINR